MVYFSGSAIGVVRHKGMIPWDDDIDIVMPREDYNRLLDLKVQFNNTGYDVVSLRDYGYYTTFAKIIDKNTTIWERKEWPFLIGVYIDVFPMDVTDVDEKQFLNYYCKYEKILKRYRCSLAHYSISEIWKSFMGLRLLTFVDQLLSISYYRLLKIIFIRNY